MPERLGLESWTIQADRRRFAEHEARCDDHTRLVPRGEVVRPFALFISLVGVEAAVVAELDARMRRGMDSNNLWELIEGIGPLRPGKSGINETACRGRLRRRAQQKYEDTSEDSPTKRHALTAWRGWADCEDPISLFILPGLTIQAITNFFTIFGM